MQARIKEARKRVNGTRPTMQKAPSEASREFPTQTSSSRIYQPPINTSTTQRRVKMHTLLVLLHLLLDLIHYITCFYAFFKVESIKDQEIMHYWGKKNLKVRWIRREIVDLYKLQELQGECKRRIKDVELLILGL
ncbi:hypothetical protein CDL12_19252 [Handroanthus impetiginosus]|uniref:Uncharacterized protein n=1 Tax=Handroanthus impetiginosus TaxID=429701 RepID=A0A2G9GSI9_9LAMI|nr:hypothetical protein CDL12_19252 [Handroanthus impetiginosus]